MPMGCGTESRLGSGRNMADAYGATRGLTGGVSDWSGLPLTMIGIMTGGSPPLPDPSAPPIADGSSLGGDVVPMSAPVPTSRTRCRLLRNQTAICTRVQRNGGKYHVSGESSTRAMNAFVGGGHEGQKLSCSLKGVREPLRTCRGLTPICSARDSLSATDGTWTILKISSSFCSCACEIDHRGAVSLARLPGLAVSSSTNATEGNSMDGRKPPEMPSRPPDVDASCVPSARHTISNYDNTSP